jgi:hypothetical protein
MKMIQKDPTFERGDVGLRSTLEGQGVTDIKFDADNNMVSGVKNGQTNFYNPTGLRNDGGTFKGTSDRIKQIVSSPQTGFRDTLVNKGYTNVTYIPNTAGVTAAKDGMTYYFTPTGLTNYNGTLIGTNDQISGIIDNSMRQVRQTGNDAGIYVGVDANGNPTYNGQTLDTSGMVNIDGRWYASGDYLDNAVKAATNKYEDPYKGTRDKLLEKLLGYDEFEYNPNNDKYLQDAMELARRAAMRSAVDRGVGGSSIAEYAAAAAANGLIPQYEDRAYQRYLGERDYLGQLMGYVGNASDYALGEYDINNTNRKDDRNFAAGQEARAEDQNYKNKYYEFDKEKFLYEQKQDAINNGNTERALALDELDKFGYATDYVAKVLGVEPGTPDVEVLLALYDMEDVYRAQVAGGFKPIYDYINKINAVEGEEGGGEGSQPIYQNWGTGYNLLNIGNNSEPGGYPFWNYRRFVAGGPATNAVSIYGDTAPVTTTPAPATSGGGTTTDTNNAGKVNKKVPSTPITSDEDNIFAGATFDW